MQFCDLVLSRAGHDLAGSGILVESGLRHLILASYQLGGQTPQGSLSALVDSLELGDFGSQIARTQDAVGSEARIETAPSADFGHSARIDLLWQGKVEANASFPQAEIGLTRFSFTGAADLDADIPGGAPADPVALETARRAALLGRLQAAAEIPAAFGIEQVDWLLARANVSSVADLIALDGGTERFMQLALSFTPIAGSATVRKTAFPVCAAVLVRDVTALANPLATLLHASRAALARLDLESLEPRQDPQLPAGRAAVMWIVDSVWFDDPHWPGVTSGSAAVRKADRIAKASAWLATHRIALNAVSPAGLLT